jgi:hypothetical protein
MVRAPPLDEENLAVAPDAALTGVGKQLAHKSASLGRFYAVLGLTPDDRARVLQAARGIEGVRVNAEGEGRHRRLVFRPEKPAPLPKRVPDDDEDV